MKLEKTEPVKRRGRDEAKLVLWKRQLALLCLGALCLGGGAGRAAPQAEAEVLTFPAQAAQEGESFSVSFDLPEGWTLRAREPDAGQDVHEPLALASVTSIYDLYDAQGGLAGAVGYSPYEPYEGERDAPAVVYAAVRMGSVYRFDTEESYEVVKETDVGANAVMDVVLQEGGAGGSATLNRGVLAYDRDRAVFVAFELDAGRVTAQQQRDIAASVEFTA